jgi:hypothetical protein
MPGSGGGIYLEVASVTTFLPAGQLYEAHARRAAGRGAADRRE